MIIDESLEAVEQFIFLHNPTVEVMRHFQAIRETTQSNAGLAEKLSKLQLQHVELEKSNIALLLSKEFIGGGK